MTVMPIAVAALLVAVATARADDPETFAAAADVFERRCVQCHSANEPKGGFALDRADSALAGGESGAVIEPGDPQASLLVDYITGDEPLMPKRGDPLSKDEVAAIRRWIVAGARWPDGHVLADRRFEGQRWWSLEPLVRPDPPVFAAHPDRRAADGAADPDGPRDASLASWIRTPIDAFILAKLLAEGLRPSAEADRRVLIRRLAFDLHGLPPTPEAVEAFVNDPDPLAYERLVDRLLASPRYGERWGRHWLDVVHYGDTHGYDKDKRRPNAWPYRDYVIRSFNEDKPYGRFIEEQLAGDVLYPDDPDGIVATGFIAAGPWDFVGHVELAEGTVDKRITRDLDRDNMLTNAMSTFVSLTAHCARCHDHKFDPISQREYYSLQSVFAGVERADRPYVDRASSPTRARLQAQLVDLESRIDALARRIEAHTSPELHELRRQITELESASPAAGRVTAQGLRDVPRLASRSLGYHSSIMPGPDHEKWVQVDLGASVPFDHVILFGSHVIYGGHPGPGFGFPPRLKVEASDDSQFKNGVVVVADFTAADLPHPGNAPVVIAAPAGTAARHVRITATRLWKRTDDFIFALSELAVLSGGANVALGRPVASLDTIEAKGSWGREHLVDGFFAEHRFDQLADQGGAERFLTQLAEATRRLTELRRQTDAVLHQLVGEPLLAEQSALRQQLADVRSRIAGLPPQPLVYAAASQFARQGNFSPPPGGMPRPIHVLHRGSVTDPREAVQPAGLACVATLSPHFEVVDPNDEGQRRAALARWITDPRHPLTWRSIANRIWHYHFGRGIVDTPNDFGRMGGEPTHPELLDWLAVELRDGGQSLKALHRLIVTSSVYRQASTHDEQMAAIDRDNRFLWRQNRQRLEAEAIRDAVLAASGRMDERMYGPGYDLFGFKDDHSPHYKYREHDPDDPRALRRTVYRFIVRSVPDPFMECLDCADPSQNVPVRNTTLTALQALSLLNNKFMVRQAEHFAARADALGTTPEEKIAAAYRLALGRAATDDELAVLLPVVQEHGMENLCRLIFNLNEFVFVD